MPAPDATTTSGRFARVGALVLTVLVFGLAVAVVTFQLRAGLRDQILRREADTLVAAAAMQLDGIDGVTDAQLVETGTLLAAVMKTSRFPDVVGVRIFDANRRPDTPYPWPWTDEPPAEEDWRQISAGATVARLWPHRRAEDVVEVSLQGPPQPAIEVWAPLRRSGSPKLIGAAQYWVRGARFAADMAEHDQRLWRQALIAWLVGSAVIVGGLSWAFRRLAVVNAELAARGEDLQRANRELVLAAKTSALGAVTAHLMHELKNPLAGLEVIVAGQPEAGGGNRTETGGELAAASELTRRLRTMVNDVVSVLRDEQTSAEFELTAGDVVEIVSGKVQSAADERGVRLEVDTAATLPLAGRRANLATLVLRNLAQNAIEATPAGGTVRLSAQARERSAEFLVEDNASGLPPSVRERLFQPCATTKAGGSGLGLALSYQLAQHAGGRLELLRSDGHGTSFRLVLPAEA